MIESRTKTICCGKDYIDVLNKALNKALDEELKYNKNEIRKS